MLGDMQRIPRLKGEESEWGEKEAMMAVGEKKRGEVKERRVREGKGKEGGKSCKGESEARRRNYREPGLIRRCLL